MKFLGQKEAVLLDKMLMGSVYGFSLAQLVELAGLSVSHSVYATKAPPASVCVVAGPGNNGNDGLVAARHLQHMGYKVTVFTVDSSSRPISAFRSDLYKQLKACDVPVFPLDANASPPKPDVLVDGLYGFSFSPPIRPDGAAAVEWMKKVAADCLTVAIDIPSGWDVEKGLLDSVCMGVPDTLISLSWPKQFALGLPATTNHFVGGRFIPARVAAEMGLEIAHHYKGTDQIFKM